MNTRSLARRIDTMLAHVKERQEATREQEIGHGLDLELFTPEERAEFLDFWYEVQPRVIRGRDNTASLGYGSLRHLTNEELTQLETWFNLATDRKPADNG